MVIHFLYVSGTKTFLSWLSMRCCCRGEPGMWERSVGSSSAHKRSKSYAGTPFAEGWGEGWGSSRKYRMNRLYYVTLALFTPIMFLDAVIYQTKGVEKPGGKPGDKASAEAPLEQVSSPQNVSTAFAADTCGTMNHAMHANASMPLPLSNGKLNTKGVSFYMCECECISNSDCDRFVFEPGVDQKTTGYCQLRQSTSGVSRWEAVQSFNDPLHDVQQTPASCVWAYDELSTNAADQDAHVERQCHEEGTLLELQTQFSRSNAFLKEVCAELPFSTCYGRTKLKGKAAFSRQADTPLDCKRKADQDLILNELEHVDCWKLLPPDAPLYVQNLTIAVVAVELFLKFFGWLDSALDMDKRQQKKKSKTMRLVIVWMIRILICGLYVYFGYALVSQGLNSREEMQSKIFKNTVQNRAERVIFVYVLSVIFGLYQIMEHVRFNDISDFPWNFICVEKKETDTWEAMVQLFGDYAFEEKPQPTKDEVTDDLKGAREKIGKGRIKLDAYKYDALDGGSCCCNSGGKVEKMSNAKDAAEKGFWTAKSTSLLLKHVIDYPDDKFFTAKIMEDIKDFSGIELWQKIHDLLKNEEDHPTAGLVGLHRGSKIKNDPGKSNSLNGDDVTPAGVTEEQYKLRQQVNWDIIHFVAAVRHIPPRVQVVGASKNLHWTLKFEDLWTATWNAFPNHINHIPDVDDALDGGSCSKDNPVWWQVGSFEKEKLEDYFGIARNIPI